MTDIERAIAHFEYGISHDIFSDPVLKYAKLAVSALRAQQEQERNEPLTLDELRKMDEEPVWIKADHYGVYADIVHIIGREEGRLVVSFKVNYRLQENGYGKTWLAYRRKPLEGK